MKIRQGYGIVFALAAFAAGCALGEGAYEIGEAMKDEAFWKSDPVFFVKNHQEQGFKWTSETRESADSRREGGVTCFGMPVYESKVAFGEAGGIDRVELTLFNRGGTESVEETDLGDGHKVRRLTRNDKTVTREEFFGLLKKARTALTPPKAKTPDAVPVRMKNSQNRQASQTWPKTELLTQPVLTWNYVQAGRKTATFKPGFIRLSVDGPARTAAKKGGAKKESKGAASIAANVMRNPRGDVFIDNVPMVDQGMKGYCSAATAERVMRYYGLDVDEHEVADAAGTQAEEGTSSLAMKKAVEAIGKRFKLSTNLLYGDFEKSTGERIANLTKEVANYNKAAKKLKKAAITEDMYVKREGDTISYSPSAVDEAMDAEVLKEMKVNGAQKSSYKKFKTDIHQYVNAGVPLFWGVTLGTYPESDLPQTRGGHMRLIIGFNDKKNEILYTDSWGKGHELKRMPMDWAWTISHSLLVMKPLKK